MSDSFAGEDKEQAFQRRKAEHKRQREEKRRERVERLGRENLSREEFTRKVAEEERAEIRNDPDVLALKRWGEERRRAAQAAAEERQKQEAQRREAAAQEALAKEKQRQRNIWVGSGLPASEFEAAWENTIKREVLMEKRRARLAQIEIDSVF